MALKDRRRGYFLSEKMEVLHAAIVHLCFFFTILVSLRSDRTVENAGKVLIGSLLGFLAAAPWSKGCVVMWWWS